MSPLSFQDQATLDGACSDIEYVFNNIEWYCEKIQAGRGRGRRATTLPPLNYRSIWDERKPKGYTLGVIALCAAVGQLPWIVGVVWAELAGAAKTIATVILVPLPAYAAILLGCLSFRSGGVNRRNIMAVLWKGGHWTLSK